MSISKLSIVLVVGISLSIFALIGFSVISDQTVSADDSWLEVDAAQIDSPMVTNVCGVIAANATWTVANGPYVICADGVTVAAGVVLTLQPGVVVKFQAGTSMLVINGTLIAQGVSGQPVVFTSLRDDAHGGDTNGDGAATAPARGDWGKIEFSATSTGSIVEHAWIGYGGYGSWTFANYGMVYVRTSNLILRNNTLVLSGANDGTPRAAMRVYDASPTIAGNEFRQNAQGIVFEGIDNSRPLTLTANVFISNTAWAVEIHLNDHRAGVALENNTAQNNGGNGCYITGSVAGAPTYRTDAASSNFPFFFTNLTVRSGAVLTLPAGTIVKMGDAVIQGRLLAQGTRASPVIITSLRDDTVAGDTNNDGATTQPGRGDWGNLVFDAASQGGMLDYVVVRYGGGQYTRGQVEVYTSQFTLTNSWISHSGGPGLYIQQATPTIHHNQFANNSVGVAVEGSVDNPNATNPTLEFNGITANNVGIEANSAKPIVRNNAFYAQQQYAMAAWNLPSPHRVDARENWWGDPGGPTYDWPPTYVRLGSGDYLYYGHPIDFMPWLETPPPGTMNAVDVTLSLAASGSAAPGGTATYNLYYGNYRDSSLCVTPPCAIHQQSDETVRDAILEVVLPVEAEFLDASARAIYWPERHVVFWKLGDLPYGAHDRLFVSVRFFWGLPEGQRYAVMARFSGSNLSNGAFNVAPYLAYQPKTVTAINSLSRAAFDARRAQQAELNTLYEQAVADGYGYGGTFHYQVTNADSFSMTVMIKSDRSGLRMLRDAGDEILVFELHRDRYRIFDTQGGAQFDIQTDARSLWGAWDVEGGDAAPQSYSGGCNYFNCSRNCEIENLANCTIGYISSAASTILGAFQCLEGMDLEGCGLTVVDAAGHLEPGVGCVVGAAKCRKDCLNPSTHCCTEPKWERSVWSYLGAGDVCAQTPCNTTVGIWGLAATRHLCAFGEKCVAGSGSQGGCKPCGSAAEVAVSEAESPCAAVAGAANSECDSTRISVAKDPNAKYAPAGDLLPGQMVTYTITYENEGAGVAYSVYVEDTLSEHFDLATVQPIGAIAPTVIPETRKLYWLIGELQPKGAVGSTGAITFTVRLKAGLSAGTEIVNQAIVHFPTVPETTPTNPVVNVIRPVSATPLEISTEAGQSVNLALRGVDVSGAALSYSIVTTPTRGALSGAAPALRYTPMTGFIGVDSLFYKASSINGESTPALVTIRVNPASSDVTPPQVKWTSPASREFVSTTLGVAIFTDASGAVYPPVITLEFNEPVDAATVNTTTVTVASENGNPLPVTVQYQGVANQAVVHLRQPLSPQKYTITVSGVRDLKGNAMTTPYRWDFYTTPPSPGMNIYLPAVQKN